MLHHEPVDAVRAGVRLQELRQFTGGQIAHGRVPVFSPTQFATVFNASAASPNR